MTISPLSPPEASRYLRQVHGTRASVSTLAAWRRNGKGPKFRRNGPKLVDYEVDDLDDFALKRRSQPLHSNAAMADQAA